MMIMVNYNFVCYLFIFKIPYFFIKYHIFSWPQLLLMKTLMMGVVMMKSPGKLLNLCILNNILNLFSVKLPQKELQSNLQQLESWLISSTVYVKLWPLLMAYWEDIWTLGSALLAKQFRVICISLHFVFFTLFNSSNVKSGKNSFA